MHTINDIWHQRIQCSIRTYLSIWKMLTHKNTSIETIIICRRCRPPQEKKCSANLTRRADQQKIKRDRLPAETLLVRLVFVGQPEHQTTRPARNCVCANNPANGGFLSWNGPKEREGNLAQSRWKYQRLKRKWSATCLKKGHCENHWTTDVQIHVLMEGIA